jgi:hypothetical protein
MLDKNDRYFFLTSIIVPVILWWVFFGRAKYSLKGQR